jgi:hypothetical protein
VKRPARAFCPIVDINVEISKAAGQSTQTRPGVERALRVGQSPLWLALIRKGTPAEVIDKLNREINFPTVRSARKLSSGVPPKTGMIASDGKILLWANLQTHAVQ